MLGLLLFVAPKVVPPSLSGLLDEHLAVRLDKPVVVEDAVVIRDDEAWAVVSLSAISIALAVVFALRAGVVAVGELIAFTLLAFVVKADLSIGGNLVEMGVDSLSTLAVKTLGAFVAILVEADSRGVFGLEIVSLYKRLSSSVSAGHQQLLFLPEAW